MPSKLAIAAFVALGVSLWWGVGQSQQKAVAQATNKTYKVQLAKQETAYQEALAAASRERLALQEAAVLSAERREELQADIEETQSNMRGAIALVTDEDFWCASEPSPAVLVDFVRLSAASRRN